MASFNRVILAGYLTRDCEMRYTPKGIAVATFGIAVNRTWKSEDGQEHSEATFVDITAFGRTAEVLAQYTRKGDPLLLEGRLKLEQWEDKNGGGDRQKLKVILETFSFLKSKGGDGGSDGPGQDGPNERPGGTSQGRQQTARERVEANNPPPPDDSDEVPF